MDGDARWTVFSHAANATSVRVIAWKIWLEDLLYASIGRRCNWFGASATVPPSLCGGEFAVRRPVGPLVSLQRPLAFPKFRRSFRILTPSTNLTHLTHSLCHHTGAQLAQNRTHLWVNSVWSTNEPPMFSYVCPFIALHRRNEAFATLLGFVYIIQHCFVFKRLPSQCFRPICLLRLRSPRNRRGDLRFDPLIV
jgi:hypothetical protein